MNIPQLRYAYRRNEDMNSHAENYVLLANAFGNKLQRRIAQMNLDRNRRLGHSDIRLSGLCHEIVNPLYSKLDS